MYEMAYRTVGGLLAMIAGVVLFATVATAGHNEPAQAKSIKGNVVTAYEQCTTPTLTTDQLQPACAAVRSSSTCGFSKLNGLPKGKGQLQLKSLDTKGWSIKLKLLGLEQPICNGRTFSFRLNYRTTAHNCAGATCTALDQTLTLATCHVERGSCKINVPVLAPPDVLAVGGTEIFGFSVWDEVDGKRAFEIGLMNRQFEPTP